MKIALLVALLLSSSLVWAQDSRLVSTELKSSGYFTGTTFHLVVTPQIGLRKRRHAWGIGPTLLVSTTSGVANHHLSKLSGIQGNYRFYPNGNDKKVSVYFFDELNLQSTKDRWTSTVWNTLTQDYTSYQYVNREYILQNTAGYGIALSLGKRWSLYQGVGVGLYYSVADGDEETAGAPEIEEANAHGYSPLGFSWSVSLGVQFTWTDR